MLSNLAGVLVFAVIVVGFLGLLQIWLWRQDRSLVPLAIWGVAGLLGATGAALLLGRNVLPHWVSIDLAVTIFTVAVGVAWAGARRLEHQTVSLPMVFAGTVLWLAFCQVPALYQDLAYRVALASFIVAGYELLCMREFGRQRANQPRSRGALAAIFGANAALQLLRACVVLLIDFHRTTFALPVSPWIALVGMVSVALLAGTSLLLIAVAKEEAEQRSVAIVAQARDAADRANLAKSRFLARMSHELRTPLNGVLGMAQVLTRDPSLQGVVRERAATLEEAGRHLLAIINDILDLASVEAGRFQLAPQPVAVADLVQGSLDLVADNAVAQGVALRLVQQQGVPQAVLADARRVRQVLLNLVGNAIKFTPRGGSVTLTVGPLEHGGLRLEVADTGRGVPAALRPHLSRDFAQRPLDMAAVEGTGLGLAISASLAQAMNGTLRYRPGPDDRGSVFTAELPLPAAAPAPVGAKAAPPVPTAGLRVLVVDDVASNRRLAEALLAQAGHRVALAEDGAAAIAALAAGEVPDIVLMDVFMPELDGLAATRRIRALDGAAGRVPIIALTADASPDRVPAYHEAGMNGWVTKPFGIDALLAAIGEALAIGKARAPAA